jgi:hypothetical protein
VVEGRDRTAFHPVQQNAGGGGGEPAVSVVRGVTDVGLEDHIGKTGQRVTGRERFGIEDIESRAGDAPLRERRNECGFVHKVAGVSAT